MKIARMKERMSITPHMALHTFDQRNDRCMLGEFISLDNLAETMELNKHS
jgi:hypothetical protein